MRDASHFRRLERGLSALNIATSEDQRQRLGELLALLHKWNRAYNLTAIRSLDDMVTKHLLDSAAVLPAIKGPRLLDVGAGPGLPGLVLAILAPALEVTLLDSNGKKVRFQRQAVVELGLDNVTPVQARIEDCPGKALEPQGFDQIISRAFASLADFVTLSAPLLAPKGQWLAMKGRLVEEELAGLPPGVELVEQRVLRIPEEVGQRHLLILEH
ncbi:16S rRNA (guanine(527)-N(7))-methyltransferase RsmG [Pistricoccus aurantiacus]|uniref:Ribosomal RNA small subunit methyltransferase G n=2 Tax=Pistricoccus aurantiacus TaxID=1883414 RepID=A0A5B8SZ95_9GAMM|nr:16S rRNA (guanine(527)-N(7))-methyltransferase RsmG [Pistricoccus aurantiacus]